MGKHTGDFELAYPMREVFNATANAIHSLHWKLVESDETTGTIEAKAALYYGTSWDKASWGTTITVTMNEAQRGQTSLHIQSKTRFQFSIIEGRTKKDVEVLHEKVSKLLSGNSLPPN